MKPKMRRMWWLGGILSAMLLAGCTQAEQKKAADTAEKGLDKAGEVATKAVDKTSDVVSNAGTTGAIKSRILATKGLPASTIDVDTVSGVVTLRGTVRSRAQKIQVTRIAQSSPGVKRVVNRLAVKK